MGSEWAETSLNEVADFRNGAGVKQVHFAENGTPLARVSDFTSDSIDISDTKFVESNHAKSWESHFIKEDDVIVATVGSWPPNWSSVVGKVVRAPRDAVGAIQNQNTCCVQPDTRKLDNRFLFYRLKQEDFAWHAANNAGGSANQARLPVKKLGTFSFRLPPLPEQKAIAHILGNLDDKIELNRRMNATLEGMAQALFKSWFVDFDPVVDNALAAGNPIPDELAPRAEVRKKALANGTTQQGSLDHPTLSDPKSLFPASFQQTDELGWIPEGWEVRPLDKIAHYQNGLALQKFRPKDGEIPMPVVKIAQLKTGEPTWDETASPSIKPECILNDGDVVFSWSGSLMVTLWCGGQAALNQHLFKVTSQDYPKWFFLEWTKKHLEDFQRIAADKAVTMGHIKRSHLSEAMCLVPSATLIEEGSRIIPPIIDRLISNELENRTLIQLRDTLLPKLISGELRLPEAEHFIEKALP
jgi:type I restriction enzyme, S subunit